MALAKTTEMPEYNFTTDDFSIHIPVWEKMLDFSAATHARVLEIGSHEGMSATWLIENKLRAGDEFHIIDAWGEKNGTEARFDSNLQIALARTPGVIMHKHKGYSNSVLPELLASGLRASFDLIYVDACHYACNVLEDLVLSSLLCKVGGVIICDDYLWHYEAGLNRTPKLAIDAFTNCFREKIEIIRGIPVYQVFLRKFRE
jgi:predicted O-methyltransferase YrrM